MPQWFIAILQNTNESLPILFGVISHTFKFTISFYKFQYSKCSPFGHKEPDVWYIGEHAMDIFVVIDVVWNRKKKHENQDEKNPHDEYLKDL